MAGKLDGKTALVTGGGSGIGRAIATRFAAEGAHVVIVDFNEADGNESVALIESVNGTASFYKCDVSQTDAVAEVFAAIASDIAPIDILINNAGVAHVGSVADCEEADFDRIYQINVKGVYNCLRPAVAQMQGRGGVIINLASVASHIGIADRFAYSMSKGAVFTMTQSIATDFVHDGIRCNSISPGRVHTPFVDGFIAKNYPGKEQEMFEKLSKTQPIGRMAKPEEVAGLALYLASDEAAFITGSDYPIDGGFISIKQ